MAKLTDKQVHERYRFYVESEKSMKETLEQVSKKIMSFCFFEPVPIERAIEAQEKVMELNRCRLTVLKHLRTAQLSVQKWENDRRNIRYCAKLFSEKRKKDDISTKKN